eukprot:tig00000525_g1947.t1
MASFLPPRHQAPPFTHPDKEIVKYGQDLDQYRNRWTRSSQPSLSRMQTEYQRRYLNARPRTDPGTTSGQL